MPVDYEVLWNGENDGRDGDLLREGDRVTPKRGAVVLVAVATADRVPAARILAVLPWTRAEALGYAEIMQRSACTQSQVNSALFTLRKRGVVESVMPAAKVRHAKKRAPQRYWRTA
jgi:hypothetical protein